MSLIVADLKTYSDGALVLDAKQLARALIGEGQKAVEAIRKRMTTGTLGFPVKLDGNRRVVSIYAVAEYLATLGQVEVEVPKGDQIKKPPPKKTGRKVPSVKKDFIAGLLEGVKRWIDSDNTSDEKTFAVELHVALALVLIDVA